jgi:hypothetical protein
MTKTFLLLLCTLVPIANLFSQGNNFDTYQLHIKKAEHPIKLDGVLDEPDWQFNYTKNEFRLLFPNDTANSKWQTVAHVTFDNNNLYFAAKCLQRRSDYTVQSLRRDFGGGTTDVLNVILGPAKDGLNGFIFSVSPYNVQREGLLANGADMALEWDNKWYSAVQNYTDYWTVEIAIPFKTLRYTISEGQNIWALQFLRTKIKDFEVGTWAPIPYQYPSTSLAFCGQLIWDTPPPKPGANISLIPYAIGGTTLDYIRNDTSLALYKTSSKWNKNIGGDAKIAINSGLNLDLTINPDFSQVEVDRQVANLSRFELFFPETRQFFLENRDLFAMYGFPETRPFFSRRIGLGFNPVKRQNEKVPILAGARLSGKLNDNLRIGLLNMQTERKNWDENTVLPAANFTVATVQQKVFSRSIMSAVLVNKQNFLKDLNDTQKANWQPWNRVAGLEYNLYSKDNRWEGEWYYHRSLSPDKKQRGSTLASFLGFTDRFKNIYFGYNRTDSTYSAEAGFVPRKGVQSFFAGGSRNFYPKSGWAARNVAQYQVGANGNFVYGLGGQKTDRRITLYAEMSFSSLALINTAVVNEFVYLFEPFDPTGLYKAGTEPVPVGDYNTWGYHAEYTTGSSNDWQGAVETNVGSYFKGDILNVEGRLAYRMQPVGLFSVLWSYNRIRQPAPYASANLWLIGPRAELSFRRDLFLSAFFQYNTQANNFNVNARLQWRFAPVSDVFLVYTDNSFAQPIANTEARVFTPKNKAVVLKVVYWLNV